MRKESKIEKDSVKMAEVDGWYSRKFTSPGRRGAFDRVFMKAGRIVWIEYKDPERKLKLDPLQGVEYRKLKAHGAEAFVCESTEGTCQILGIGQKARKAPERDDAGLSKHYR